MSKRRCLLKLSSQWLEETIPPLTSPHTVSSASYFPIPTLSAMSLELTTQSEVPTYDLEGAVGRIVEIKPVTWTTRDLLLYAVGLGAGKDDLRLVYGESILTTEVFFRLTRL